MTTAVSAFDELLATKTRAELKATAGATKLNLTLPQAQRLTAHAESLGAAAHSLRLGIVHTYTSDLLDPWLNMAAALQNLNLQTYHAPYGLALQEAQPNSPLVQHAPDLTLFMLRREDLHPDLSKPVVGYDSARQQELRKEIVERLGSILGAFRAHKIGQMVLTLLPSPAANALGVFDTQAERAESAWWAQLKSDVGAYLRDSLKATLFLDLDDVQQQLGRAHFFDLRYWYSARFPFTADASREFARRVMSIGAVLKFPRAKVIVLDADNTLWGGIIGEDGMTGIALGPDYPGNVFVDFQRRILDFQQRGFILAMCSKNNPADVDEVLKNHPHQILRDEHFAAKRVNWTPKPDNLVSLAEELNLGLDSFMFVDDSHHECAAVRHHLPQVEVVQTPSKPLEVPSCLDRVARLEILALTKEDLAKTEMYAQERQRRQLSEEVEKTGGGVGDYLSKLNMKMRVEFDPAPHLSRLSQLTQKTNQFNLTTRRYDEQRMQEFVRSAEWLVADFSLADSFGDSGIVGLAILRKLDGGQAELDTFLMSCRVIGRHAEAAFLHTLLRELAKEHVTDVVADYLPTAKNVLVKDFLPDQGFVKDGDGRYRRNLRERGPQPESAFPIAVELVSNKS